MRLRILAVGTRMPAWVDAGFDEYAKRMPRELAIELTEIRPEPRNTGRETLALLSAEAQRISQALPARAHVIALDERGADLGTAALADKLQGWMARGEEPAFLIGGPDGLDASLKAGAGERWRLSSLTLPHGLVRVILAEALYRAASLLRNHPYHRA